MVARCISVNRIGGDEMIALAISGNGFSRDTQVILDRNYVNASTDLSSTLITVDIDASVLAKYKKLIVKNAGDSVLMDIPGEVSPPPPPT